MTWFLLAIFGPFLYALTNHLDKLLLEKYFKEGGVGTLMMFSSLLSVIMLPFVYVGEIYFHGSSSIFTLGWANTLILCTVGLLYIMLLWFYLKALEEEEATNTVIYYQLVPVFGVVLGYFILGEILTQPQIIAMGTIILGTSIIAVNIDDQNRFSLRLRAGLFMIGAALCWALASVIFKFVALEENVWVSLFWENTMLVIIGIIFYFFVPNYRKSFVKAIRLNSKQILSINVLNEVLYMFGNAVVAFAFLMAPIALVLLANSFQPIFTLIIGVFITIYFPMLGEEKIGRKHIIQKLLAILITGIGTYLLLTS